MYLFSIKTFPKTAHNPLPIFSSTSNPITISIIIFFCFQSFTSSRPHRFPNNKTAIVCRSTLSAPRAFQPQTQDTRMLDAVLLASFLAMGVVCENNNTTPPGGYYATKYDHIDVDRVLNSRRLVMYYAACLTNKGPCTPQGLEFKSE